MFARIFKDSYKYDIHFEERLEKSKAKMRMLLDVGGAGVLESFLDVQSFFFIKGNRICAMTRYYKRGFGWVTKHTLLSQLIPVALDEEIKDMVCEKNEEDDVMPIITIANVLANAPFEEVSVVITEDDE